MPSFTCKIKKKKKISKSDDVQPHIVFIKEKTQKFSCTVIITPIPHNYDIESHNYENILIIIRIKMCKTKSNYSVEKKYVIIIKFEKTGLL